MESLKLFARINHKGDWNYNSSIGKICEQIEFSPKQKKGLFLRGPFGLAASILKNSPGVVASLVAGNTPELGLLEAGLPDGKGQFFGRETPWEACPEPVESRESVFAQIGRAHV